MTMLRADITANTSLSLRRIASELRSIEFVTAEEFTWTSWEPVFSASGAMTLSAKNITYCKYMKIGKRLELCMETIHTTGGVASTDIYFTTPPFDAATVLVTNLTRTALACTVNDGGTLAGQANLLPEQGLIRVKRYDNGNWGLGTGRTIRVSGFYEVM